MLGNLIVAAALAFFFSPWILIAYYEGIRAGRRQRDETEAAQWWCKRS